MSRSDGALVQRCCSTLVTEELTVAVGVDGRLLVLGPFGAPGLVIGKKGTRNERNWPTLGI
jgi:hypothetical protein